MTRRNPAEIPQYSLPKILLVWAAAATPMAILGWLVAPALALRSDDPMFVRLAVLAAGLAWQFALVCGLLYWETSTFRWATLTERLWLNAPRSPTTGERTPRLWWCLIPIVLLTAVFDLGVKGQIDHWWTSLFPLLAEPPAWDFGHALATPQARAQLEGAWSFGVLFLSSALFNTFLGEELLFRGVLLPRMAGVFGRADWAANGLLFAAYHLHQPWGFVSSIVHGALLFALPTRHVRSAWFGIAAHSGQSLYFSVLILLLILGWS